MRYSFDVFNLTNTTSLDVPTDHATVSQRKLSATTNTKNSVAYGQVATGTATQASDVNALYVLPVPGATIFGAVRNTIGQPRTIEMSLHLIF